MGVSLQSLNFFYTKLLNDPHDLDLECFRQQIRMCQTIVSNPKSLTHLQNDREVSDVVVSICNVLLKRLESGFESIDVQLLCSTTLYSHINFLSDENKLKYVQYIHAILCRYLEKKEDLIWNSEKTNTKETRQIKDAIPMSFINGFFHSVPSVNTPNEKLCILYDRIVNLSLRIVLKLCMTYSNVTFVSFRNLNMIVKKVLEWNIAETLSDEMRASILYVVLYNWENPLTGIKDQNLDIFSNYVHVLDSPGELFANIMDFPWTKAKYFSLCALMPRLKFANVCRSKHGEQLIYGLKFSISHSHLVSAGADLYKTLLQYVNLFNEWYDMFFDAFNEILLNESLTIRSNLMNHWLTATIKKFPSLVSVFLNNFLEAPMTDSAEHSFLTILKLGRKHGVVLIDWHDDSTHAKLLKHHICTSLKHINDEIRLQAIHTVCDSYKTNSAPSIEEFSLFKKFYLNNVNYDSPSFRQGILNSFTTFLIRIRDSFISAHKQYEARKDDFDTFKNRLEDFFVWLHAFIDGNLHSTVNYQRKIISLQMLDVTLRYMFSGYLDKSVQLAMCRKSNQRSQGWRIVEHLKSNDKWRFEDKKFVATLIDAVYYATNDVRDIAANIIMQYYLDSEHLMKKKNELFVNGMIFSNSKKFYEAESGSVLFKLLSVLDVDYEIEILRSDDGVQKNILSYLVEEAVKQFSFHKEDVLYSICSNQPLYGLLSSMNLFILNSNKAIEPKIVSDLIPLIHDVSNFLLKTLSIRCSEDNQNCPSFSEMSESIEYIISLSKCETVNYETHDLHLSNAHQMVLNIIWLNMKACCDLASTIITSSYNVLTEEEVKRCLELNVLILTRCRHKGAIESAGASLGQSIKFLTSLKKNVQNKYISEMLEQFLCEVTQKDNFGRSITRRSAGLTILVHRIVTNDSQDKKPLFHLVIKTLLKTLSESETVENLEASVGTNVSNEKDLPHATALHLLCRTVTESSLSSCIMQYASQLLIVSIKYFASEHWQIRNAALQLYGALIPKLIGQKNKHENASSIDSTVTPDELFSHIPQAWEYIINSLRHCYNIKNSKETFLAHSNLIPVLGLLSNMAKRYRLSRFDTYPPIETIYTADVDELFVYLLHLLGSPIYIVRNMSAKIIRAFYDLKVFYDHWKFNRPSFKNENKLHGYLLVLNHYTKFHALSKSESTMIKLNDVFQEIGDFIDRSSFESRSVHFDISTKLKSKRAEWNYRDIIVTTLSIAEKLGDEKSKHSGFYGWMHLKCVYSLENCHEDILCDLVQILCQSNMTMYSLLQGLKTRTNKKMFCSSSVLNNLSELMSIMISKENTHLHKEIFEILFILLAQAPIEVVNGFNYEIINQLLPLLNNKIYNFGHLLPLLSLVVTKKYLYLPMNVELKIILQISNAVKKYSNCNVYDSEVRLMCVLSVQFLTEIVTFIIKNNIENTESVFVIKCNILTAIIWMLQDEEASVRHECSKALLINEKYPRHPTYKLRKILTDKFIKAYFNECEHSISRFFKIMLNDISINIGNKNSTIDSQNLFYNQTRNPYWELELLKQCILSLQKTMITAANDQID